jgi:hypothetical protein
VDILLVRVDAELKFVVTAGLNYGGVASVKLARVQVVREFFVLKNQLPYDITNYRLVKIKRYAQGHYDIPYIIFQIFHRMLLTRQWRD